VSWAAARKLPASRFPSGKRADRAPGPATGPNALSRVDDRAPLRSVSSKTKVKLLQLSLLQQKGKVAKRLAKGLPGGYSVRNVGGSCKPQSRACAVQIFVGGGSGDEVGNLRAEASTSFLAVTDFNASIPPRPWCRAQAH